MPNGRLFSRPDPDRSGPAVLGREPVVLPEHRRKAVRKLKDMTN